MRVTLEVSLWSPGTMIITPQIILYIFEISKWVGKTTWTRNKSDMTLLIVWTLRYAQRKSRMKKNLVWCLPHSLFSIYKSKCWRQNPDSLESFNSKENLIKRSSDDYLNFDHFNSILSLKINNNCFNCNHEAN